MSRTNLIICTCIACTIALSAARYRSVPHGRHIPTVSPNQATARLHPAQTILLGGKIDINVADAEAFEVLEGVGPVRALRIVEDRARDGFFSSVNELTRVYGIGQKTIEKNRYCLKVSP